MLGIQKDLFEIYLNVILVMINFLFLGILEAEGVLLFVYYNFIFYSETKIFIEECFAYVIYYDISIV